MRHVTSVLFALLLGIGPSALVGCDRGAPGISIDGAGARALVAQGATLVDVRTPMEWEAGHVEGAVLIPLSDLGGRLREIPRDRPVVVYCGSGSRSARAAAVLSAAGYNVRDLGGMARWNP
jgi:rhodanese-related sulfurtransferase